MKSYTDQLTIMTIVGITIGSLLSIGVISNVVFFVLFSIQVIKTKSKSCLYKKNETTVNIKLFFVVKILHKGCKIRFSFKLIAIFFEKKMCFKKLNLKI